MSFVVIAKSLWAFAVCCSIASFSIINQHHICLLGYSVRITLDFWSLGDFTLLRKSSGEYPVIDFQVAVISHHPNHTKTCCVVCSDYCNTSFDAEP